MRHEDKDASENSNDYEVRFKEAKHKKDKMEELIVKLLELILIKE